MTDAVPTSAVPMVPGVETLAPEAERTRPSADAALTFDNVSKQFPDGTVALTNVSFEVCPREFVTVVGPSGCGKSTLLRIASGLTETSRRAASGSIATASVTSSRTRRSSSGARSSATSSSSHSSTAWRKPERRRLAQEAIDLVGLTGFEDKYPKQLSGGMKMRASLARSLTPSPNVFLFDEPFGALDEITRERLNDELLGAVPLSGLRLAVHHALDLRGGVPVHASASSCQAGPGESSATSTSRSSTRGHTTCGSNRSSPRSLGASPTPSGSALMTQVEVRATGTGGRRRHQDLRRAPDTAPAVCLEVVPRRGHRAVRRLHDRHRRLVLHLVSAAEASAAIPDAAAAPRDRRRVLRRAQPQRADPGPVELDQGRDGRARDRDRARDALRHHHEPGEVDRTVALPLRGGAPDHPDPRPRAR